VSRARSAPAAVCSATSTTGSRQRTWSHTKTPCQPTSSASPARRATAIRCAPASAGRRRSRLGTVADTRRSRSARKGGRSVSPRMRARRSRAARARSGRGAAARARAELTPTLARREERAGGVGGRPSPRRVEDRLAGRGDRRGRFVQVFVHNGCVVPARSGAGFDPFALHGRTDPVFGGASRGLRRGTVADLAPRNVVCRGYVTSRSDS
jgi:hypothetical protein